MQTPSEKEKKSPPKKKGPIRFEAIIPVGILSISTFIYFSYYFDTHMKKLFEYVGTQANGAEVNIESIKTSFIKGSFDMNKLEITNPEQPTHNQLEIGNIHFKYVWDALLRMKFVVEDASINNLQIAKLRKYPGKVVPPQPATPSKIEALQEKVISQIKTKYNANMLGDVMALLEGEDYESQIQKIRETLKSEIRVKEMISEVQNKKEFWDQKVKELSDTSKIKEIETIVTQVQKEKNFAEQAKGIKNLTTLLKDVDGQYKEIEKSSKLLQAEVKSVANFPKELQALVADDIASLKGRFSIPQIDFKDMAMHLFAAEFAQNIAKARKYQALAKQYLPEKKEEENIIIPPKRSEGKSYDFPITAGYPLFWLKRAAISSKGTLDSYSGQVSGELRNVTTSPKTIKKPIELEMKGDFPSAKIMGVKTLLTLDFTKEISRQTGFIQINSFDVPEKIFVDNEKMRFGFKNAVGTTTISATLQDEAINMNWTSTLLKPQFLVETKNKIAKELLNNVLNSITAINIAGTATGTFNDFNMNISSNLGDELSAGFKREIGLKISEAQGKISSLVDDKINKPKSDLMAALGGNSTNVTKLDKLQEIYKKNQDKIKAEIEKLKNGGGIDSLKEKGKKLFKGLKF